MYYELYIDVLFLENLLLDYLLLALLRKLLMCPAKRIRMLAAAALGSAGVCVVYVLSLERTFFGTVIIYVVLSTVMVKAGLRIKDWRLLLKAVALLYISSLLLGGIFELLQRNLTFPLYPFLAFSLISYQLLSVSMEWLAHYRNREGNLFEVTISFQGRTVQAKGLLDTGNHLQDPIFHKPVSILTEELQKALCGEAEVLFLQIPFHSIGKQDGIMAAFFADYLCIRTAEGGTKLIERPLLGITKEPLSSKNEYGMILHPDLFV